MTATQLCLIALVLVPVLASALSVILPEAGKRVLTLATAAAVPAFAITVAAHPTEVALGGFDAPLGIVVRADGLAVVFVLLTAVVGTAVSVVAVADPRTTGGPGFHPLWLGAWGGLNAVFISGDLFNMYVGLELVSLTAVGLVALGGGQARAAALRYLFIAVPGSLLFLTAIGLIVAVTGTLDLHQVRNAVGNEDTTVLLVAVTLASVGLAMKVALVPMHRWLIPAHSSAPTAVSPLLSALVLKASLVVIIRIWMWLAVPVLGSMLTFLAWMLAALGMVALVYGSVMALRQTSLKAMVAYSTVVQVGYWFLFLPIVVDPTPTAMLGRGLIPLQTEEVLAGALVGTVALAVGHGLAKSGLFLAVGFFKDRYGTDDLEKLRGLGRAHPMILFAMGLSAIGLAGVPFSLSFVGKWALGTAAVSGGDYWLLGALVIGTLFSAAYMVAMIRPLWTSEGSDQRPAESPHRVAEWVPQVVPLILGTLTVVFGFTGVWFTHTLEVGLPW